MIAATNAAFVLLALGAAMAIYRLGRGPTIADRMVALDTLLFIGAAALGTYIARTGENLKCNLATGIGYSILDVISMTEEITGRKVPFTFVGRREGDPSTVYATSTIAEEKLGWKAVHSDLRTLLTSMWGVYGRF